jgi:hypothetical protein
VELLAGDAGAELAAAEIAGLLAAVLIGGVADDAAGTEADAVAPAEWWVEVQPESTAPTAVIPTTTRHVVDLRCSIDHSPGDREPAARSLYQSTVTACGVTICLSDRPQTADHISSSPQDGWRRR